jgi:hypothetical protein
VEQELLILLEHLSLLPVLSWVVAAMLLNINGKFTMGKLKQTLFS